MTEMKKNKRPMIILICIIVGIVFFSMIRKSVTEEDTIGDFIVDIAINPVNGILAFPTSSEFDGTSKIEITDADLNPINTVNLNWHDYSLKTEFSHDGSKLYVCIASMPGWENTDIMNEDGKLAVIDTTTWNVTYHNLPHYPMGIYVTSQDGIVYLTCGYYVGPVLMKFNALTGQVINSINGYTNPKFECGGLSMNQDETKLYIDGGSKASIIDAETNKPNFYSRLHIFDSDLNRIAVKFLAPAITDIVRGPDNKIYISHSHIDFFGEYDYNLLSVLNSITNEIEHELIIPDTGAGQMKLDPVKNVMYLSIAVGQESFDPNWGFNFKEAVPTNSVMQLNLSDWSYSLIEVANETIGPIALSPSGDRLYAAAVNTGSKKVYYVDLEFANQDLICVLECPTSIMLEVLPIAVVFDASGSYDPDGDPITYHWDFNGDGIFDGIGDEYTGDPWNPTHEFTSYAEYEVSLKVMDDKDGECVETVVITIIEG